MASGCRIPYIKEFEMKRVYVREDVCMACGLCRVYCLMEHSKAKNIIKAFKKETPRPLSRIRVERKGEVSFSFQCRHCDEPWCVYSCLTGAMHRDLITGAITVDAEKCMGCWTCIVACPNGALVRDMSKKVVVKCDLCPEHDVPVCVVNCPNEALIFAEKSKDGRLV
jgi:carbon-monoxide dehydrogenase iron sulfur subunit